MWNKNVNSCKRKLKMKELQITLQKSLATLKKFQSMIKRVKFVKSEMAKL